MVIAELSANHNGCLEKAKDTIKAAADSGADAIKIQTYTPDTMTIDCRADHFLIRQGTLWDGQTLYDLYKTAFTPWEWHEDLFKTAEKCGILCFSTPFDKTAVDFLEQFNPPAHKIASFEANDTPLIAYAAAKGRPMIISTGLSDQTEIRDAVGACKKTGNSKIALLKCTSSYPARTKDMNIRTITDMAKRFKTAVGLSDHSMGIESSCAAIALGAKIIEKHFIITREDKGPDSTFSIEPEEFSRMVRSIRITEKALGKTTYTLSEHARQNTAFKRSLFSVEDIKKGEKFTAENIRSIRPGYGLAPKYLASITGKTAAENIPRGTPLDFKMIEHFKRTKQ